MFSGSIATNDAQTLPSATSKETSLCAQKPSVRDGWSEGPATEPASRLSWRHGASAIHDSHVLRPSTGWPGQPVALDSAAIKIAGDDIQITSAKSVLYGGSTGTR